MDGSLPAEYWLTRFCFQRFLGLIYFIGFLIAANQFLPLLGEHGLLPVRKFLQQTSLTESPSVFWFNPSDRFIQGVIWFGVALSAFATLGFSERYGMAVSVLTWFLLWAAYLSIVNVGQTFYGFGWETLLLETGFLAIFLGSNDTKPPVIVMWLILWLLFRVMFGAGMIKLRGDSCWKDLTCMFYHYETQPLPNPLSWYFHYLPKWAHKGAVLYNHFVELIVPWCYFAPRPLCYLAGGFTILFQLILIFSGNLSWLNYITILLCIPCFDDRFLSRFLSIPHSVPEKASQIHFGATVLLALLVLSLSIRPARNLFSRRQMMNASFEPLHLVNTYGAFGSITRERYEVVIEGTDADWPGEAARWREYQFKGKPGDVRRRPCIVSPYHYKIDWQMWFAAMSPHWMHEWFVPLIGRLLQGDPKILGLLAGNPFPERPPQYVRARLYLYHFTAPGKSGGAWWTRELVAEYFPAVSLEDLRDRGLLDPP